VNVGHSNHIAGRDAITATGVGGRMGFGKTNAMLTTTFQDGTIVTEPALIPAYDGTVGNGPFFALKIYPSGWETFGSGMYSTWTGQLTNQQREPVGLLYMVGVGNFRERMFGGYNAGTGLTLTAGMGRLAASDAVMRLKTNGNRGAPTLVPGDVVMPLFPYF